MSTSLHDATREMLLRERTAVTARLQGLAHDSLAFELDSDFIPPSGYARENAMSVLLEQRLCEIDDALAKIDGGTYGLCERCGKEIPPRRLEVLPFATLCVPCQSLADKKARPGHASGRAR